MAEIIRATEMGFCMGVRRAVQMMVAQATPELPIASAGEIVHNPHVVRQLERAGVRQLPGPDDVDGDFAATTAEWVGAGRVAVTAHGVGERVFAALQGTGLEVVDTTCPVVTRAQRYGQKFVREGRHVLILGDPGHKEVRGITGWCLDSRGRSQVTVVEQADLDHVREVVETFPGGLPHRIGVMAQTTHRMDEFARFVGALMLLQRDLNFDMHVVNTLCHATTGQQTAAAELASRVDVMVIVGGRKSANTRHLREVCEAEGVRSYQVEGADELRREWFEASRRIGLTAGASTPDASIDDVEARLVELTRAS